MPIQTFWTNQGNNNVPVFQSTPGDSLPNPLGEIAGVNGTDVTALDQQSATLSPPPVATGAVPPGFNLPPTSLPVDEFEQWHSAYQIQYLQQHPYNTPPGSLAIGNAGNTVNVILSSDQSKVYFLDNLTKADISKMSNPDQTLVADSLFFQNTLSTRLQLTSDKSTINNVLAQAQATASSAGVALPSQPPAPAGKPPVFAVDFNVFGDEINLIQQQVNNQTIVSNTDIQAAINQITSSDGTGRADVARSYAQALVNNIPAVLSSDPNQQQAWTGVMSTDNNASIQSAYTNMIRTEQAILANKQQAQQDAVSGKISGLGKQLDAPNLIADFQMFANVTDGYINKFNLAVINQQNELVKTYAIMQDLVQKTLQAIRDPKDDGKGQYALLGVSGPDPHGPPDQTGPYLTNPLTHDDLESKVLELVGGDTAKQQQYLQVISMFDQQLGTALHPEEARNNVARATFKIFDDHVGQQTIDDGAPVPATTPGVIGLQAFNRDQWNGFGTELSGKVTLLQQNNQIEMNNINSLQQEQTQHFSLLNDVLSKASSLYQSIGRNITT